MSKKKQLTQEEIEREIAELDQELAELEAAKTAEQQAALAEPIRVDQAEVMETYLPFAKAVKELRSVWEEVEMILVRSENLREEISEARDTARSFPEEAPADLRRVSVPDTLISLLADEKHLRSTEVLTGRGDQMEICGRRFVSSRLRNEQINGLTKEDHHALNGGKRPIFATLGTDRAKRTDSLPGGVAVKDRLFERSQAK